MSFDTDNNDNVADLFTSEALDGAAQPRSDLLAQLDSTWAALDDAESLSARDKLMLSRELMQIHGKITAGAGARDKLMLSRRMLEIRKRLGAGKVAPVVVADRAVDDAQRERHRRLDARRSRRLD